MGGPHPALVCQTGWNGVRWERVGHQSSSEAEVTWMPRGQMEKVLQTPQLASLSQEKDLPPASQSKEKPVAYGPASPPLREAGVHSCACLGSLLPPRSLPLRGPPCICTQDPILPAFTRARADYGIQTSPSYAPNFPRGYSGQVSAALSVKWSLIHSFIHSVSSEAFTRCSRH